MSPLRGFEIEARPVRIHCYLRDATLAGSIPGIGDGRGRRGQQGYRDVGKGREDHRRKDAVDQGDLGNMGQTIRQAIPAA